MCLPGSKRGLHGYQEGFRMAGTILFGFGVQGVYPSHNRLKSAYSTAKVKLGSPINPLK